MREASVTVVNPLGLHARPAAQLVRLASTFQSRIILSNTESNLSADARSILSVLTLAAIKGSHLHVNAEGDDAEQALAAVLDLFASGFGEL